MAEILRTVVSAYYPTQDLQIYTKSVLPYYGTLASAENYFRSKIRSTVREWFDSEPEDKIASLREATRLIETLNFLGTPVSEDQLLHFPTEEDGQPIGVEVACYEIALQLLKGLDPETEKRNLSVTSQGFAGSRTTYARDFVQEHLNAGIPSAIAWSILRPYLGDPSLIKLSRG